MLPTTGFSNLRRFTRIAEGQSFAADIAQSTVSYASHPGMVCRISRGRDSRCLNLSRPPCSVERWRRIAW